MAQQQRLRGLSDPNPINRTLADWLEAERSARGLTYQAVSDQLEPFLGRSLRRSGVYKTTTGRRAMAADELVAYIALFGLPPMLEATVRFQAEATA